MKTGILSDKWAARYDFWTYFLIFFNLNSNFKNTLYSIDLKINAITEKTFVFFKNIRKTENFQSRVINLQSLDGYDENENKFSTNKSKINKNKTAEKKRKKIKLFIKSLSLSKKSSVSFLKMNYHKLFPKWTVITFLYKNKISKSRRHFYFHTELWL